MGRALATICDGEITHLDSTIEVGGATRPGLREASGAHSVSLATPR
jgi:hypothetical protein